MRLPELQHQKPRPLRTTSESMPNFMMSFPRKNHPQIIILSESIFCLDNGEHFNPPPRFRQTPRLPTTNMSVLIL